MTERHDEHKDYEQLDKAIGRSTSSLFNMSPNDVLVQISLPVILILAIATRLITIGQSLSHQDANREQAVLDLWKQHLILRVDRALDRWEKESGLPQFSDFGRVYWNNRWPDDSRFRGLCQKAIALGDLSKVTESLYREALAYRPSDTNAAGGGPLGATALYDPRYAIPGMNSNAVPPEFKIDDARRRYAFQYIEERCKRWTQEVEDLQWKMIDRLASELPPGDPLTDAKLDVQMKNIAAALESRGYPLLPGVSREYRKEP